MGSLTSLPPFTDPARCPKCHCDRIGTYYDGGHSCPPGRDCAQGQEHLERSCRRCGFTWDEAVAS